MVTVQVEMGGRTIRQGRAEMEARTTHLDRVARMDLAALDPVGPGLETRVRAIRVQAGREAGVSPCCQAEKALPSARLAVLFFASRRAHKGLRGGLFCVDLFCGKRAAFDLRARFGALKELARHTDHPLKV